MTSWHGTSLSTGTALHLSLCSPHWWMYIFGFNSAQPKRIDIFIKSDW